MATSLTLRSLGITIFRSKVLHSHTHLQYAHRFLFLTGSLKKHEQDPNDPKYAAWKQKPHPETPTKYHPDMLSPEPVKGKVFERMPLRVDLEAGKKYMFCTCGYSKTQPFCDSSHKAPNFMSTRPHHIRYRPMPFQVEETKEYWLCMCKQSNKRPFCDGSHKRLAAKS
ncbi:uncharacterized protein LOC131940679 [Physella acuta]|uniref:uncharacterized protein LOC131940679 n=1 Tax=Physella acuta TaxID=109671 RepID=UPI0027DC0E81|nr:uncharacterized protein LOC131940679 [Physella acuta]